MTLSLVKPAGWNVSGDPLTNTQLNQLDTDHVNSVDKAGDTISGMLTFTGENSSGLHLTNTSSIALNGELHLQNDASIRVNSGASVYVDGSSSVAIGSGSSVTINETGSISFETIPDFVAPVTRSFIIPLFTGKMFAVGDFVVSSEEAVVHQLVIGRQLYVTFPLHTGAILQKVTLYFKAATTHAGLPAATDFPGVSVARLRTSTNGGGGAAGLGSFQQLLSGGGVAYYSTASLATYNNGSIKSFDYVTDQFNLMGTSTYNYILSILGERGGNYVSGARFIGAKVFYTTINDKRFA